MSVSICACGHPWPAHASRKYSMEFVQRMMRDGESVCSMCHCSGYLDALEVDDRFPFRVTQKQERGNFGVGHPLMVALAKTSEDVAWLKLECGDCGIRLEPGAAIVLDSKFYCGECFLKHPEVYCD